MKNMYAEEKDSEIEAEIRNLEEKECKAMLTGDAAVLQQVWAEDFMVNAHFNKVTLSRQEVIDLVKKGVIRYSSLTRTIEQVMVKQGIVITMGSEAAVPVVDGPNEARTTNRRYTNIWMAQMETGV
jgi:hypothetical protein